MKVRLLHDDAQTVVGMAYPDGDAVRLFRPGRRKYPVFKGITLQDLSAPQLPTPSMRWGEIVTVHDDDCWEMLDEAVRVARPARVPA